MKSMGIAIIVMILITIVLYLIVLASEKTRELKREEQETLSNINNLLRNSEFKNTYIKELMKLSTSKLSLILRIIRLKQENKRIKESNEELRDEYRIYLILKQDYEARLRSTIIDLLDIQDISSLGISEEEKNKNRNVIINKIIKDFSDEINELDASQKTSSSK